VKVDWRCLVAGLAVGGALGFVWGLLNAPYSGTETQQRIAEKVEESIAEGRQAMAAREREMREAFARAKTP